MNLASHSMSHDPFASGVLHPEVHDRLVKNVYAISQRAGLGPAYASLIWTKPETLNGGEEEFVRRVVMHRRYNTAWSFSHAGLAYGRAKTENKAAILQTDKETIHTLREMTAKLVRNFVDARMLSPAEIGSMIENEEDLEASVLIVRDLMLPEEWPPLGEKVKFFSKQQRLQLDTLPRLLIDRANKGMPTVVHVRSPVQVIATYMPSLLELFHSSFICFYDLKKA